MPRVVPGVCEGPSLPEKTEAASEADSYSDSDSGSDTLMSVGLGLSGTMAN